MITPVRTYSTILLSFAFLLLLPLPLSADMVSIPSDASPKLTVYTAVPGLTPDGLAPSGFVAHDRKQIRVASDQYSIRLRLIDGATTSDWYTPFAFKTYSSADPAKPSGENNNLYVDLAGWSHTYVNFEMQSGPGVVVEAEITKLGAGATITKAVARPGRKVVSCTVSAGKAYVKMDKPCQVAIDINGQMEDQSTGLVPEGKYTGPAIHTVTLFANPILASRPKQGDAGVLYLNPGDRVPSTGTWNTLCFGPGVHDIGLNFQLNAGKSYYIPGDAIVYGTMNNDCLQSNGSHIRIFGYGTLSGKRLYHPDYDPDKTFTTNKYKYSPIHISGAMNTSVEGVTIADAVYHSIILFSSYDPTQPTDVRWVKVFTWIGNGDGINAFHNGLLEDCFIRTQDDCTYVRGRGMRRLVTWNDANGCPFVLSNIPNLTDRTLVVEDCDVIYSRCIISKPEGATSVFNTRGLNTATGGNGLIFRNINIDDPHPSAKVFGFYSQTKTAWGVKTSAGDLTGILFQNIHVAARNALGYQDSMLGVSGSKINHLTFENYVVEGTPVTSLNSFLTNEYVSHITFLNTN